ncbi:MAG: HAD-IIIC family phosphatase [Bryobacteraceae bacterium]|jgi:FkbH-like protein
MQLPQELQFPIAAETVLRKRTALRRELLNRPNLLPVRIAILGGSTTQEIRGILEIFLLARGIQPSFYESAYGAWHEEVMYESPELWSFKPDIVFVHTTWHNVSRFPDLLQPEAEVDELARAEMARFEAFWKKIHDGLGALVIQNNFDLPRLRPLGNLEAAGAYGRVNFLLRLNAGFAKHAATHSRFLIDDILYLSAQAGLAQWFDYSYWYNYHMAVSPVATVSLAQNVAAIVQAVYGKSRKCLVLDLDNTLWGGVIGDDGLQGLLLGRDHPVGEAFAAFQRYVKGLRARGVLLAVCSKNDLENAREGFSHPDTVLKLDDFSAFKASWNPKPDNIREIAAELNIGLDSLVFVDDNPAERAIVAAQLPEVAVPDVGSDVSLFAEALEREAYFEPVKIVADDLERAAYYSGNAQRSNYESAFASYDDFLASLEMTAEIGPFVPVYLERIAQLINKTNQFNLTTRRYTAAEVEAIASDPASIALYGRLADRFGDNGLVSVVIGKVRRQTVEIDLWLMSCRVLKREMEYAMFDALVEECRERGVREILGVYIPSKKNGMVAEHYGALGFSRLPDGPDGRTLWRYEVPAAWSPRAAHIRRTASPVVSSANA